MELIAILFAGVAGCVVLVCLGLVIPRRCFPARIEHAVPPLRAMEVVRN
jgi:hypothetical protein